jgi:hypothetical protein
LVGNFQEVVTVCWQQRVRLGPALDGARFVAPGSVRYQIGGEVAQEFLA